MGLTIGLHPPPPPSPPPASGEAEKTFARGGGGGFVTGQSKEAGLKTLMMTHHLRRPAAGR